MAVVKTTPTRATAGTLSRPSRARTAWRPSSWHLLNSPVCISFQTGGFLVYRNFEQSMLCACRSQWEWVPGRNKVPLCSHPEMRRRHARRAGKRRARIMYGRLRRAPSCTLPAHPASWTSVHGCTMNLPGILMHCKSSCCRLRDRLHLIDKTRTSIVPRECSSRSHSVPGFTWDDVTSTSTCLLSTSNAVQPTMSLCDGSPTQPADCNPHGHHMLPCTSRRHRRCTFRNNHGYSRDPWP